MNPQEIKSTLSQFTGTINYHQLYPKIILTDGTLFLAEKCGCFWLLDLYSSYLAIIEGKREPFTVLKLIKNKAGANITIDNGNGVILAEQEFEFTDFPLEKIMLYGRWTEEYWVLMLTGEY